jgi:hypothetical protein
VNIFNKWRDRIYWRLVDYVEVDVKWPSGEIVVDHNDPRWADLGGAVWIGFESADPNDHYRPFLEQWIGRQGWDWDWRLAWHGRNIETGEQNGRLTIRMRKKHAIYASHIALMWN